MSEEVAKQEVEQKGFFKFSFKERTITEILNDLYKTVPDRYIKQRKQGGKMIDYVPWFTCVKLFEYYAPGWEYSFKRFEQYGEYVFFIVSITIHGSDGSLTREASGQEELDGVNYGTCSSNAESMALRRAMAKFGFALHLYDDDGVTRQNPTKAPQGQSGQQTRPQGQGGQASAQSTGAFATEKQVYLLQKLIKEKNLSEIDVCLEVTDNEIEIFDRLTKKQASELIESLK